MDYITIYDYLLMPVYLFAFYFLVIAKAKKYGHDPLRKYLITGFFLHMGGSLLYCMVVQYYYGYGDSFGFFQGSNFIRNVISSTGDPFTPFFMSSDDFEKAYGIVGSSDLTLPTGIDVDSNLTVMKISAALSYVSFNSYVVISMFFGLFAFTGLWKLYKTFNEILEKKTPKLLAFAVLYMPSVCFYGSGLIKDSICLGAIGFIVYYMHKVFVKKKFQRRILVLLPVMVFLLFIIKSYIAIGLMLSMAFAYMIHVFLRNKKSLLKLIALTVVFLASTIVLVVSLSSTLSSIIEDSKTHLESFQGAFSNLDEEDNGSGFTNDNDDISANGIISRTPLAVVTTVFRPFLWEVKKPIMLFSALESLLALLATLFVLVKCRVFKFFYYIFTDPNILFSFVFSMLLAVIIGLSTFNFGTLVRYRLPILPFYFFMLLSIYTNNKEARRLKK